MLTLEQAKNLTHGTILHYAKANNADGSPQRWRVIGRPKTWKRSPERVEVPLKHGLRHFAHLTENDLADFSIGGFNYY